MPAPESKPVYIEFETPSSPPSLYPPSTSRFEYLLPPRVRARRRHAREADALLDWERRTAEWEAAGRPPVVMGFRAHPEDVLITPRADGGLEIEVRVLPFDADIFANYFPLQETPDVR